MTKLSAIVSVAAVAAVSVHASHIRSLQETTNSDEASGSDDVGSWEDDSGSSAQFADVAGWDQCGGANFDYASYTDDESADANTKLECETGFACEVVDPLFFRCQPVADSDAVPKYGQCGGIGYVGSSNCADGLVCVVADPWFAQCLPKGSASASITQKRDHHAKKIVETDTLLQDASEEGEVVGAWEQCGGKDFDASDLTDASTAGDDVPTLPCEDGYTCNYVNDWYFQCQPLPGPYALRLWEQCGGVDFHGDTDCNGGVCKYFSDWYSQCVPKEQEFS